MSLLLTLVCFFAAAIAVGVATLLASITPALPAWLIAIIQLGLLLIALFWLRAVLGV